MPFLGASIIAGLIFFLLSFLGDLLMGGPNATTASALVVSVIKTAIFSTAFHYCHNWVARTFDWYNEDDPEKKHVFDKTPGRK